MGELATGIDRTVAHSARMWNYCLGGKDNYQVDRDIAEEMLAIYPGYGIKARTCRYYLFRAVRFLTVEEGVRQFLDIGTGLPTAENTHQVAQQFAPESRIVYVDNDPLVLAHARSLLTSSREGTTCYVDADLREPDRDPRRGAPATLDFRQPIAPAAARRARPRRRLRAGPRHRPAGSSTACRRAATWCSATARRPTTPTSRRWRTTRTPAAFPTSRAAHEQIVAYFAGLELLEPGVVPIHQWRPGARARGRARRRRRVRRGRPQAAHAWIAAVSAYGVDRGQPEAEGR